MPGWRWHFYDPTNAQDYELEINPNEGGSFGRERKFTFETTAASDGGPIIFEGAADPRSTSISGVILTQSHFEALDSWAMRYHQIRITDDLGRVFWVVFRNFRPKRKRSANHPWRHDFDIDLVEVNVA